jgi:peptide/nickel transport system substrate-binding protein
MKKTAHVLALPSQFDSTRDNDMALEHARVSAGELGNHAIDEFKAGRLSRRALLRHASLLGVSLAAGGLIGMPRARAQAAAAKPGATIRVAHLTPAGAVDPLTVTDAAGLSLINQTGEFLIDDDGEKLLLRPSLALSWNPNAKGDVWTFKLRPNVKFHNGQPMTAKDVAATFNRLADPASGSAALSVLKGVLSKDAVKVIDDMTVEFHLDAPNGNFPYYVSSDTYNAVILPAGFSGTYEKSFMGTGPFRFQSYTPKVGAVFVRNADYWGEKALPERVAFTFYADQQAQLLAMQGRQADVMGDFSVQGGLSVMSNPEFKVLGVKSSAHRQMHMRNDTGPFKDKRVRQALALAVNREVIVKGLFRGHASLGNDSPFSPVFPSSDLSVPQRVLDIAKAKQLLAAAGVPNGFDVTLTTEKYMEIPDLAVVIQNAAKAVGIRITLKVESQELYYGAGTFGKSDWLDSPLGITDYGHRGVPNVFLNAPLTSNGTWNSAHFKNPQYDKLVADFVAALDVASQKKLSGQIQNLLLDETPVVIPYFYDQLIVTRANVKGVGFNAISQLYFQRATIGA